MNNDVKEFVIIEMSEIEQDKRNVIKSSNTLVKTPPVNKNKPITMLKQIKTTVGKLCMNMLKFIWSHPTMFIKGVPFIVFSIYFIGLFYTHYHYIPYCYGIYTTYTSYHNNYKKIKKHAGYIKKIYEYIY